MTTLTRLRTWLHASRPCPLWLTDALCWMTGTALVFLLLALAGLPIFSTPRHSSPAARPAPYLAATR